MGLFTLLEKRLEEVIAGIGVVVMTIMVFFQVVMRYVFSLPTSWSDEIAQYCMLWSVYLSVSWAVRERAHIRVMNFINLFPQAIKNVIPGIVNNFISLFKDTTLVLIIGLFDLLGMVQNAINNPKWISFALEGYIFAGLVYWIFCFSMSRYSLHIEKKLKIAS